VAIRPVSTLVREFRILTDRLQRLHDDALVIQRILERLEAYAPRPSPQEKRLVSGLPPAHDPVPSRVQAIKPDVLKMLRKAGGGVRTGVIVEALGAARRAVRVCLEQLEREGQVKMTGKKSGARWHYVGRTRRRGAAARQDTHA